MKLWLTALLNHYAQPSTTLAQAWQVTRRDLATFGWTDFSRDIVIAGDTYTASQGFQTTNTHSTDDFAVNTIDVTAFLDVSTEEEIAGEVWDNALILHFEYNWSDPPTVLDATTVNILRYGHLGQIRRQENVFTAEVRSTSQQLTKRIGRAYSPTCPWRHALWNGSTYISSIECNLDLTSFIVTGAVTILGSPASRVFGDEDNPQIDAYYNEGLITFTTGDNAQITREVRASTNSFGIFDLYRPFPRPVQIGDEYVAVVGDDKTFFTCQTKFNNVVNAVTGGFGGFPDLPGIAAVFQSPTQV